MNSIPPGALQQLLPEILPKAVAWAEEHSAEISALGSALGEAGLSIARRVGVRQPELIRVSMIRQMPFPAAPLLREAAAMTGLLGSGTIGLTLGHGIYIRQGHYSPRLLSHECRHVYQHEVAGSIAEFLRAYLREIVAFGYQHAPYEIDARAHEVAL